MILDGKINIGGHNSQGESYTDFQTYLKSLKDRGILLSICSKNNEKIALDGFKNNNMVFLKKIKILLVGELIGNQNHKI